MWTTLSGIIKRYLLENHWQSLNTRYWVKMGWRFYREKENFILVSIFFQSIKLNYCTCFLWFIAEDKFLCNFYIKGDLFCLFFYILGGHDRQCLIDDECRKYDNVLKFRDSGDFVRIDSEGRIIFIGRKDRQVKRNGCRLHLGEIEKVISIGNL